MANDAAPERKPDNVPEPNRDEPGRREANGLSYELRSTILNMRLDELAYSQRIRLIYTGPHIAVYTTGERVNHLLHALLTVSTFGLWGIVWIILAARGGERWIAMTVDADGKVYHRPIPPR